MLSESVRLEAAAQVRDRQPVVKLSPPPSLYASPASCGSSSVRSFSAPTAVDPLSRRRLPRVSPTLLAQFQLATRRWRMLLWDSSWRG